MKVIPISPETSCWQIMQPPRPFAPGEDLFDQHQRPLRDLRISITDRCNFRCVYCMPREVFGKNHRFMRHSDLLSFEEITRLARRFVAHGVAKIRITGGEPLLRKGAEKLIAQLANIPGLELALTTNGVLLPRMASRLKDAGLNRITVSLDTLDESLFRTISDGDFSVSAILEGIDAATQAGFDTIKINMVVQKGLNEQSILGMASHFRNSGHVVRFIEFMDVGMSNGWDMSKVIPSRAIIDQIRAVYPLEPISPNYPGEVAERWRYRDGGGEIGVISSVTQAFCSSCTRLRLSTEGKLYTCLFAQHGHDLRQLLRANASDDELDQAIAAVWQHRQDRYSELREKQTQEMARQRIEMSYIGG